MQEMAEGCKTEHLTTLESPACCSSFSSEGFEFLQFPCLSNTNILNVCSRRYKGCFPTCFVMSWGCLKGWQNLVSDTIQTVCTRLPTMPHSYDFSQKVLCFKCIHFFLNGQGTPFLCMKKPSKKQLTDSFLGCGVPKNIPRCSSFGMWSPAGKSRQEFSMPSTVK